MLVVDTPCGIERFAPKAGEGDRAAVATCASRAVAVRDGSGTCSVLQGFMASLTIFRWWRDMAARAAGVSSR